MVAADIRIIIVAPRRGAWIETGLWAPGLLGSAVAPRRGAWIETLTALANSSSSLSHPAGVRGLKRTLADYQEALKKVAPRRGAWIETSAFW